MGGPGCSGGRGALPPHELRKSHKLAHLAQKCACPPACPSHRHVSAGGPDHGVSEIHSTAIVLLFLALVGLIWLIRQNLEAKNVKIEND